MPLFASLADMQAAFEERDLLELSDQDNTGQIDAARIEGLLVKSDTLIISYIAARYKDARAFAGDALLRDIACDYAFSLLWRSDLPEWVKDRRKAALAELSNIAKGVTKLDDGVEEAAARPGQILITSDAQRFSRNKLSGY